MRILYTREDGGLSVVHAAPKSDLEKVLGSLTDEAYKEHVLSRSVPPNALNAVEIDDSYQLPDREFRDAWKQNGKEVGHDLEKARTIQLNKIREARAPKLLELDKEFMLALEKDGVASEEIVARKQALRDITEPLKNAVLSSIDDVKKAFPEILK